MASTSTSLKVGVVIPTYKEEENIGGILEKLVALDCVARVVVADDSSPDRTGEIVNEWAARDPRVRLLTRTQDRGYGRALRDGIQELIRDGVPAIGTMDADHSHDPAQLPGMLRRLENADLVIGSRYVPGGKVLGWPLYRHILSRSANAFVRFYLGLRPRDCTSGFRVYRSSILKNLKTDVFRSEGYSLLPELARRVTLAGGKIAEHPITFTDRTAGQSKMGMKQVLGGLRDLSALKRQGGSAPRSAADEALQTPPSR